MNIKKAIKCIRDKYEAYDGEYCAGTKEINKCYKEQDEIIALLIELKQYRKGIKFIPAKPCKEGELDTISKEVIKFNLPL